MLCLRNVLTDACFDILLFNNIHIFKCGLKVQILFALCSRNDPDQLLKQSIIQRFAFVSKKTVLWISWWKHASFPSLSLLFISDTLAEGCTRWFSSLWASIFHLGPVLCFYLPNTSAKVPMPCENTFEDHLIKSESFTDDGFRHQPDVPTSWPGGPCVSWQESHRFSAP